MYVKNSRNNAIFTSSSTLVPTNIVLNPPVSQLVPSYPAWHAQVYPVASAVQVPAFSHGLDAQSFTGEKRML